MILRITPLTSAPKILAPRLAQIRPEVDLYLMTEIAVEEVAGT